MSTLASALPCPTALLCSALSSHVFSPELPSALCRPDSPPPPPPPPPLQMIIMFLLGGIFKVEDLTGLEWAVSILIGIGSLPVAFLVKFISK